MQRFGPYRVGEVIGRGSMATVKVAVHERTNTQVALKIIPRKSLEAQAAKELSAQQQAGKAGATDPAAGANLLPVNIVAAKIALEIKVLKLLKHPHVIRLYDVIFTQTDVVLVLEYAAGGELFDHLNDFGRLGEAQARTLFQQLLSALEYCHTNRVAHRDLKPENIILDKGTSSLKLTDFDLAGRIVDGQLFDVSCGTPNYAAPEVVMGQLYSGPEADVWSAGIVLYAMLTGRLPFDDENVQSLFRRIKSGEFTVPASVSAHARDLLSRLIVVDPLQRATVAQAMSHPWVTTSIPRYIVDIHDACLQQVLGAATAAIAGASARAGPSADGHRHDQHAASIAGAIGNGEGASAVVPDGGTSPVPAAVLTGATPAAVASLSRRRGGRGHATSAIDLTLDEDDDFHGRRHAGGEDGSFTTITPPSAPAGRAGATPSPSKAASDAGSITPGRGTAPVIETSSVALFRAPLGADPESPLAIGLLLDNDVAVEVAKLFEMSIAEVEAAIQNAIMRREVDQRDSLHRLVHGVPPRRPLRFERPPPPATDKRVAAREHDALVTYAIIKHRKRAALATRNREPATSASLGGGLASSLRASSFAAGGMAPGAAAASPSGGMMTLTSTSVDDAARAVALHASAVTSDVTGQGCLGGLRALRVGRKAVVPPPGEFVSQSFAEVSFSMSGMPPRVGQQSLRAMTAGMSASASASAALASSVGGAALVAGSYGAGSVASGSVQSTTTRSASGAVVVRQPPAVAEPAALRIPNVSPAVYNGLSRRPGVPRIVTVDDVAQQRRRDAPTTGGAEATTPLASSTAFVPAALLMSPCSPGPVTAAQREQQEQRADIGTLFDKAPQFGPTADAGSEAWAETFRVGVMAEGKSGASTFHQVFRVLKAQGFVWKVVRPFHVAVLDHVSRARFNVQLIRCASGVPNKWLLDVRMSPLCPVSALWRAADLLDAFATEFTGAASVPLAPPSLVVAHRDPVAAAMPVPARPAPVVAPVAAPGAPRPSSADGVSPMVPPATSEPPPDRPDSPPPPED